MSQDDIPLSAGSNRATAWTIGCVLAGSIIVLICGGGVVALNQFGDDLAAFLLVEPDPLGEQVAADLKDNPVIVRHVGEVTECRTNWEASVELDGENDYAFDIRGTRGVFALTATCITVSDTEEHVTAGTLRLSSGESVPLFPDQDAGKSTDKR